MTSRDGEEDEVGSSSRHLPPPPQLQPQTPASAPSPAPRAAAQVAAVADLLIRPRPSHDSLDSPDLPTPRPGSTLAGTSVARGGGGVGMADRPPRAAGSAGAAQGGGGAGPGATGAGAVAGDRDSSAASATATAGGGSSQTAADVEGAAGAGANEAEEEQVDHTGHRERGVRLSSSPPLPSSHSSSRAPRAVNHRRTPSLTSPPPPPSNFNPPPDFTSDTFLHGIETPPQSTSTPTCPSTNTSPRTTTTTVLANSSSSFFQQAAAADDPLPSPMAQLPAAASPALAALSGEQLFAQRPQIRAIQRLSSESIQRSTTVSASSTGSTGDSSQASHGSNSSPSEGSEVLAARRDELVTQLLTGNDSPESSQRTSTASSSPTMETVAIHVLNPTPPATSLRLTEDAIGFVGVGVGRGDGYNEGAAPTPHPRPLPNSRSTGDEAAHAWDSVWPAANAVHRVNLPPEAVNARFPLAPMSPYVTPSFSPAAVVSSRRFSSSSPPAFEVPERPAALSRVVSQGSHKYGGGGPAVSRSDLDAHSPPRSPRPLSSSLTLDNASSTIMSSGLVRNRPITNANAQPPPSSSSPGPSRPVPLLASSPPINVPSPAGRRQRSLSFINQFPELTPPFISRRELVLSPNRITRRLSETAIQRPDAPRRLEALAAPLPPPTEPRPDMSAVLTLSPAVHRPDGPRRARSAQDAAEGGAQHHHDPTTNTPTNNIPHLPTIHHINNIIRRSSSQLPSSSSSLSSSTSTVRPVLDNATAVDVEGAQSELDMFRRARRGSDVASDRAAGGDELMFDMDECAITDDEANVDESPTPTQLPVEPTVPLLPGSPLPRPIEWSSGTSIGTEGGTTPPIPAGLVDEGDLLPQGNIELHHEIDVTFDDEGLNTLERIFLLSRSEYAFHRAYVARVLGDLLRDVDPCESVEYVLPLISAFSLDEDDSVKEAFAADLHRILWYFYTTCLLVDNTDDTDDNEEEGSSDDAATTAADVIDKGAGPSPLPEVTVLANHASPIDVPNLGPQAHDQEERMLNIESGGGNSRDSSQASTHFGTGSSTTGHGIDTPMTSVSFSASSTDDAFLSGGLAKDTRGDDDQLPAGNLWEEDGSFEPVETEAPQLVGSPVLNVDFFRPLLGTMLLSHNSAVANPTRDGIIALVARLRNHGAVTVETWGSTAEEQETRQTFLSQTGPHEHDSLPFDDEARLLVEQEILYGIVLGMGALSTDVGDHMMDGTVEILRDSDGQEYDLQMQLEQEATLGRALSLSLIGSMSEFYSQDEVTHYGFVDEVIRGLDGDVSTRAEAAVAMGNVVKCASIDQVDRLLGVFDQFANDLDSQVRQSVCVALPALCKRIPDDRHRRDFAVSVMTSFINDVHEVRCAALEVLGEVIYAFSEAPWGPPVTLLEMYINDKDSLGDDCDWDILASFNFPGVALTLGADRWNELKGLFHRLVDRAGHRVLRTVAAFLHELAIILHPEQVAEDVLPVYQRCLDGGDDLRKPVFEHVDLLISNLPLALGWQCFRQLQDMWDHDTLGGWRAREQIALHIPSFLETFSAHEEVSAVMALMRSALLDRFAAVREAATSAVPQSYDMLGRSKCSRAKLHDVLLDLSLSSSYRQRLTFVRCLREFIRPPPNREAFERFFMPALSRLVNDIVDVRIGLARAVGDLFIVGAFYDDQAIPVPRAITNLASLLSEDDCADVRDIILRIGAERWIDVPAAVALREQNLIGENPVALSKDVDQALSCSDGPTRADASSPVGVHSRADIASPAVDITRPLPPRDEPGGSALGLGFGGPADEAALHGEADEDDVDRVGLVADPFAESFAHAAVLAQGGRSGEK